MTDRPRRIPALFAALAAPLLIAGCSAASSAAPAASPQPLSVPSSASAAAAPATGPAGQYVALGDSYTAGDGIPDLAGGPAGCQRSTASYPFLVAQRLRLDASRVHDVSCSGATIADLYRPQVTSDGTNPAQLTALSTATTLVTIGIGGNDVHWGAVLTRCAELDLIPVLLPSAAANNSTPCQSYYTSGGANEIQQDIQAAAGPLASALAEVRRHAPHARVYVVGYPDLVPSSGGAACTRTLSLTPGDMAFLNAAEHQLNSMLRQQAASSGAAYIDTYTPSAGHDACTVPGERWVEPMLPASPAAPLHPNATGEQGMASAVITAMTTAPGTG